MRKNNLVVRLMLPLLFALLLPASLLADQALPVAKAIKITEPVQMDGKLQEGFWQTAPVQGDFNILGKRTPPVEKTAFRVVYTDSDLYIGLTCPDQDMAKLSTTATERDAGQVCSDDSVEIFLVPGNGFYYQFAINAAGYVYDGRRSDRGNLAGPEMSHGMLWDGAWEVMTYQGETFWSAEVKIPFALLDLSSGCNESWRFNVGRTEARVGYTSWGPVQKGFHDLERYGFLEGVSVATSDYVLDTARLTFPQFLLGDNKLRLDIPAKTAQGRFQLRHSLRVWEAGLLPERTAAPGVLEVQGGNLAVELDMTITAPEALQELTLELLDVDSGRQLALITHIFLVPQAFQLSLPWSCFFASDGKMTVDGSLQVSAASAQAELVLQIKKRNEETILLQQVSKLRQPGDFQRKINLRKLPDSGFYQLHWQIRFKNGLEANAGVQDFYFLRKSIY